MWNLEDKYWSRCRSPTPLFFWSGLQTPSNLGFYSDRCFKAKWASSSAHSKSDNHSETAGLPSSPWYTSKARIHSKVELISSSRMSAWPNLPRSRKFPRTSDGAAPWIQTKLGEMWSKFSGSLTFTSVMRIQHSENISEPRCTPTTPRIERMHSRAHSRISLLSYSSSSCSWLFHVKSKVKSAQNNSWDKTMAKRMGVQLSADVKMAPQCCKSRRKTQVWSASRALLRFSSLLVKDQKSLCVKIFYLLCTP